ncbi:MAG: ATP-binding protein [Paracoccaceae bacterium]
MMRNDRPDMRLGDDSPEALARRVAAAMPASAGRQLVALAGPPGCGKSTVAAALATVLAGHGRRVAVVPMDGFHRDNADLRAHGLFARKGAPETFDAAGFLALVGQLKRAKGEVAVPLFDRVRDAVVPDAQRVAGDCDCVIVEGNYLLYDADPWRALAPLWDLSVFLDPGLDVLRQRLVQRWCDHGLSHEAAEARAEGNDLTNARTIYAASLPADLVLQTTGSAG